MNRQKLTVVDDDTEKINDMVNNLIDTKLQEKDDLARKKDHINKALVKDKVLHKKEEKEKKQETHKHSCPSCQSAIKGNDDGFEVCKDCGTTIATFEKGQKPLICDGCSGLVSEHMESCPNCGSTKAHQAK